VTRSTPRWWLAPALATLLAAPTAAFAVLVLFVSWFGVACPASGCSTVDLHVRLALAALALAVPLAAAAWAGSYRLPRRYAVPLCVLLPAATCCALASMVTLPSSS
jgi:hypothetical protein